MKPIRVLHLRDTDFLCGPGKTVLETVRRNRDADVTYEVAAFGTTESNPFLAEIAAHCPVVGLEETRSKLLMTAVRLARIVREREYDLIHSHDFKTRALSVLTRALIDIPLFTTTHGYIDVGRKRTVYNTADRKLLRRMDEIFAVSGAMVEDLDAFGIESKRLRLVRNCIVLENYPFRGRSDELRKELGWTHGEPIIGHVGRLSAEKGQRELLTAFQRVLEQHPNARLVFAGHGPDLEDLTKHRASLGLEDRAVLLGHRKDILDVYTALDLLILNSTTEGLPNVVLEAMALGVPVVATAVGGTTELVRDAQTGWLIPPGETGPLVDAIHAALSEPAEARRRADRAREHVEEHFGMDVLIATTHDYYRNYLNRPLVR